MGSRSISLAVRECFDGEGHGCTRGVMAMEVGVWGVLRMVPSVSGCYVRNDYTAASSDEVGRNVGQASNFNSTFRTLVDSCKVAVTIYATVQLTAEQLRPPPNIRTSTCPLYPPANL